MVKENREQKFRERMEEIFKNIDEKVISELPEPIQSIVRKEMKKLKDLFMYSRSPRFSIVGRRGAGKSSLVNAIFGNKVAEVGSVKSTTGIGTWFDYRYENGTMSILDTRGLGEGSTPDERNEEKSAKEEVMAAIEQHYPDALLFLCKAKEIDARINEDIESLYEIQTYIQNTYSYEPPIVAVITQVDELDPPDVVKPPYRNSIKQKNIKNVKKHLSKKFEDFDNMIKIIPTSAYLRFENGEIVYDRRWNIDELIEYLIKHLPNSAQLEMARITRVKSVQKKIARMLTGSSAVLAGGIGSQPIPMADLPIITGIQVSMIIGIGYISGQEMNSQTAKEFMASMGLNVGSAFAFREIGRALVKLLPIAGNVVSGAVASAVTWGIGEASIAYFIDKKSADESKEILEKETEKRKNEE